MNFTDPAISNVGDPETARQFLDLVRSQRTPAAFVGFARQDAAPNKPLPEWDHDYLVKVTVEQEHQIAALWSVVKQLAAATLTLNRES